MPLHDIKVGVWFAECNYGYLACSFPETINSHQYATHISAAIF